MFGYIYKVTNKVNNKIYIGQHFKSDNSLQSLDENYWASGIKINNAFDKYGLENFTREILEWCDSKELLDQRERFYIKEYNSTDDSIGYNIAEGGSFGNSMVGKTDEEKALWRKNISEKTKEAMSRPEVRTKFMEKVQSRGDDWRQKLSQANLGHSSTTKGKHMFYSTTDDSLIFADVCPEGYTDECPQWRRDAQRERAIGNKSRTGMRNSPEMNKRISEGLKKVVHTAEWNKKVGDARRGKPLPEEWKTKLRKPKPRYIYLLPDGTTQIATASKVSHCKECSEWKKLYEYIEFDQLNDELTSTTIPSGSTSQTNGDGSASPLIN